MGFYDPKDRRSMDSVSGSTGFMDHDASISGLDNGRVPWGGGLSYNRTGGFASEGPALYSNPIQEKKYEQAYDNIQSSKAMPAEKESAWNAFVGGQVRPDMGLMDGAKFGFNEFRSALPKVEVANKNLPIGAALLSQTPFAAPAAGLMTLAGALGGKAPDYVVGDAGLPVGEWQEKDNNKDNVVLPQEIAQSTAKQTAQKIGLPEFNIMDLLKNKNPYQAALDYINQGGII